MRWATRDRVHLDRVAAPWLIRRFIDPDADFVFMPTGQTYDVPLDATPFGIPGVDLSAHDQAGSTFRKILRRYNLNDPALDVIAEVIEDGIVWFLARHRGQVIEASSLRHPEAIGLEALSKGMMTATDTDDDNLRNSGVIYDALYEWAKAKVTDR